MQTRIYYDLLLIINYLSSMIRMANSKEAVEIMREPRTVDRIGKVASKFMVQPWICHNDMHKLLFVFWPSDDKNSYEMHIACPVGSILSCRKLAVEAMTWLFSMGAKKIETNCPPGKISNMAKKIGMSLVKINGDTHFYEVEKWL